MRLTKLIGALLLILGGLWLAAPHVLPPILEPRMNYAYSPPPYTVNAQAQTLHDSLVVADMHADSLLWRRDLLEKSDRGLVDIPRLIEGNVGLQAFTLVTKSPRGQNSDHNSGDTDRITLLTLLQGWPQKTWNSLTERALYQIDKLHRFEADSDGRLYIIKSKQDLNTFLTNYSPVKSNTVAGWIGIEGAHALDGDFTNLQRLYDAGLRMVGIAHFFDNEVGGSAHGIEQHGLTELGKRVITKSLELGMVIDVAHTSETSTRDALALANAADKPIMVSHTGVRGTCNNNRNLSDELIREIADNGGVIGVGYWDVAVCGTDVQAIARAIDYVAKLTGIEHVGLGSDYDGSVATPFDTTGVNKITEALLALDYDESDIRKIMGENVVRVLRANLP